VDFDRIWMSTIPHLEAYGSIVSSNSFLGEVFGAYRIPEGFPYRVMSGSRSRRNLPLMMLTSGRLHVDFDAIELHSEPEAAESFWAPMVRDVNLWKDFSFRVPWKDVIAIERYEAPHYEDFVGNSYFPPWARLKTQQPGELCDFLLSAGGRCIMTMREVTERAEELCGMLQRRLFLIQTAPKRHAD